MILFKRQRILYALDKKAIKDNSFHQISLKQAFQKLYQNTAGIERLIILNGKSLDIETLFGAKTWAKNWFNNVYYSQDFISNNKNLFAFFPFKARSFFG